MAGFADVKLRFAKVNVRPFKSKKFPFTAEQAREMAEKYGQTRRTIEIAPGVKMTFVRIPAGTFIMGNNHRGLTNAPESVVKISKPFWMSETEVTNRQYNVFDPKHDSRFTAQFWKDHVGPGYAANRPEQPVTRISWNQATEFCKAISAKCGVEITLPTEAQWEWACRSGSDTDFWYGDLNSDFAKIQKLTQQYLSGQEFPGPCSSLHPY